MAMTKHSERFDELVTAVDMDGDGSMLITFESGRQICIYHVQDCCETVGYHDGDYMHLVGRVVEEVQAWHEEDDDPEYESATWSNFAFQFSDGVEVLRWHGDSNGYYSEEAQIAEVFGNREDLVPEGFEVPYRHGGPVAREEWGVIADYWEEAGEQLKASVCRSNFWRWWR